MHARGVSTACGRVAPVKSEQPLAVMYVTIFVLSELLVATSQDFFRIERGRRKHEAVRCLEEERLL